MGLKPVKNKTRSVNFKMLEGKSFLTFQALSQKIRQRGVAIYLALIIMIVLLGIGVGLSTIIVGQLKIKRGMENSVAAFYAADTGVERILYEEKLCRNLSCGPFCNIAEIAEGSSFSDSVGDATYITDVTYEGDTVKLRSVGEYKGVKRAIETLVSRPVVTPAIISLDCPDPATDCDAIDWVRTTGSGKNSKTPYLLVSYSSYRSLIKWSLQDIPLNATIEYAKFHYFSDISTSGTTIYLRKIDNDGWDSNTTTALDLFNWPATDIGTGISYPTGTTGWHEPIIDITSLVQNENNPCTGNDILSLKWEYEVSAVRERYAAPNYTDDQTKRPYIEVKYH